MKKLVIVALCIALFAVLTACSSKKAEGSDKSASAAQELKLTVKKDAFEKPEYKVKSGDTIRFVNDAKGSLYIEITGMSVKLDSDNPKKEVKVTAGVYDAIAKYSDGKLIKSKIVVE